jgi:glutathione reductase (NADPH)
MAFDYDLLVVGAGSGGLAASKRAASHGAKVGIIENDLVGGTCVLRGCIPKKLMVYASSFSHMFQDAVGYGWEKVNPKFDWNYLISAVDKEVRRLSDRHISNLEKAGVELISGKGVLVDNHTVAVGDQKLSADKILLSVGSKPVKLPIPGIEHVWTSREMFGLSEQPKSMAVVGGGYIGVEFASIMNGLGTQVTEIIRRDYILRGFDGDVRRELQEGMIRHGVNVYSNTTVDKIEKTDKGLQLTLSGEKAGTLEVDGVLYAVGRKPNIENLGLENAGVEVKNDAIAVNAYSQTSQPNIFAVGDCTDRANLTPVAIDEGRKFVDTEFVGKPRHTSYENIPTAVFGDPEACSVGYTEEGAIEELGEDRVAIHRARFKPLFHNLTGAEERVVLKLVVNKDNDRVLGAHAVGKDAAEIIQGVAVAVTMGATKQDFDATMALHPSTAEEFVTM